jgi:hypothetical protein
MLGYFVGMADTAGPGQRPDQVNDPPPRAGAGEATVVRTAPVAGGPAELQARVDGLRGWLAALDRRVSIRTQVGIVLLALAVGFGAAALFVAVDARENGASEARVESLREALQALNVRTARTARQVRELQSSAGTAATGGATLESLQAQVTQLQAQVQTLQGTSTTTPKGGVAGAGKDGSAGAKTTPENGSGGVSGNTQGSATP